MFGSFKKTKKINHLHPVGNSYALCGKLLPETLTGPNDELDMCFPCTKVFLKRHNDMRDESEAVLVVAVDCTNDLMAERTVLMETITKIKDLSTPPNVTETAEMLRAQRTGEFNVAEHMARTLTRIKRLTDSI